MKAQWPKNKSFYDTGIYLLIGLCSASPQWQVRFASDVFSCFFSPICPYGPNNVSVSKVNWFVVN